MNQEYLQAGGMGRQYNKQERYNIQASRTGWARGGSSSSGGGGSKLRCHMAAAAAALLSATSRTATLPAGAPLPRLPVCE
jgi:hypothetical protein